MIKKRDFISIILYYLLFCLTGAGFEWCYGTLWSLVGIAPWIYPNSFLHYTSLEGIPLWGFGGFFIIAVHKAIHNKRPKELVVALVLLLLAALWIVIISAFI